MSCSGIKIGTSSPDGKRKMGGLIADRRFNAITPAWQAIIDRREICQEL
jgi:hypothetical protein